MGYRLHRAGNPLLWSMALGVAVAVGGCVDLSAVRDFAGSAEALTAHTALVHDYATSPERNERYARTEGEREAQRKEARKRAEQVEGLLALHAGVSRYMAVLGHLAADERVRTDEQWEALADAVTSLPERVDFDEDRVEAFANLGNAVTNAMLRRYRARQVRRLIKEADTPLQDVLAGMRAIADHDFRRDVTHERMVAASYFEMVKDLEVEEVARREKVREQLDALITHTELNLDEDEADNNEDEAHDLAGLFDAAEPPDNRPLTAGAFLAAELRSRRVEAIDKREQAIDRYIEAIDQIADTHRDLRCNLDKLTSEQVLQMAEQAARDVRVLYREIVTLIGSRD